MNSYENLYLNFESFASGKIIISGEHSVVYGKPALCIGINKFTKMKVNNIENDKNIFSNIKLIETKEEFNILKIDIINNLKDENYIIKDKKTHFTNIIIKIFSYITDEKEKEILKNFILNTTLNIIISSEFPVGFGLGSSSAYNICISNGFYYIINKLFNVKIDLNSFILLCNSFEKFFHNGTPSGIDVTTCINGGLILFKKIDNFEKFIINENDDYLINKIYIYLISSNIIREGGKLIKKVSDFKKENLEKFNLLINEISDITNDIFKLLFEKGNNLLLFFDLIKKNQVKLKEIQVSNSEIDNIIQLLLNNNFIGKITGAGGGGFIVSFIEKNRNQEFIKLLNENNLKYLDVKICNKGMFINDIN